METLLFYLFGGLAIGASLLVIAQRNVMYSVLLLIVSFGALAGLYVLLEAPFVAAIQIIIYAGAIMVLFLFVVMLLNVGQEETSAPPGRTAMRLGLVLAVALGVELGWVLTAGGGVPEVGPAAVPISSVRDIGIALYTDYAFAFEVTAVLTLVAMLGAIVLTRRE